MNRGTHILFSLFFIFTLISLCNTITPTPPIETEGILGETPDLSTETIPTESIPSETPDTSIGTIQHVTDVIEWNNTQVLDKAPLHNNDQVRLYEQGEGLLDLLGKAIFRVFNTTQLGGITAEAAPGTPLLVRMYLEVGGGTGEMAEPGGRWEITTPSGANITIYGTSFFVIYDPDQQQMIAGNYDGSMEMTAGGSLVIIPPNAYAWSEANSPPQLESPIPMSMTDFEQQARTNLTVVGVVNPPDRTPPVIDSITADPSAVSIGRECPNATGTTQVTVVVTDESKISEVSAFWENFSQGVGIARGEVFMKPVDDKTFIALVGPVKSPGELNITITAADSAGNKSEKTIILPVTICIG